MSNPNPPTMQLPVGFIFNPTDVDLVVFYLMSKLNKFPVRLGTIIDFNVYNQHPEILPGNFTHGRGRNEEIFFSRRQLNGNKGTRAQRTVCDTYGTHIGHWHGNKDDPIYSDGLLVGYKTSLTFMRPGNGDGRKNISTDWIMHEFRLPGREFQQYAICKVYNKNDNYKRKAKFVHKALVTAGAGYYESSDRSMPNPRSLTIPGPPHLSTHGKGKALLYEEEVGLGPNIDQPYLSTMMTSSTFNQTHAATQAYQDYSLPPLSSLVHQAHSTGGYSGASSNSPAAAAITTTIEDMYASFSRALDHPNH